jgi:small subunit ribosomal protein S1
MRGKKRQTEKMALIGKSLHVVVLEVQPSRRRLVLSERVAQRQRRATLLEELYEGAIRTGTVRNLTSYGAFVDLGGVDGLLHISQLSWDFVEHPRDVLNVGDEVEVYVLGVDRERERISLSRKHLLPPEWVGNLQAEPTE